MWSTWGPWTDCSRECHGRRKHDRRCNSPPPEGFMRMCPGIPSEYEMCNNHPDNCTVVMDEITTGVSLTFPLIPIERVSRCRHYQDLFSPFSIIIIIFSSTDDCIMKLHLRFYWLLLESQLSGYFCLLLQNFGKMAGTYK